MIFYPYQTAGFISYALAQICRSWCNFLWGLIVQFFQDFDPGSLDVCIAFKEAVREYRRENGFRYTDSKWRLKNFGECCRRLAGITYKISATPYVQREYLQNAHLAIKKYYKVCQQNELMEQPSYEQKTMSNYYDLV